MPFSAQKLPHAIRTSLLILGASSLSLTSLNAAADLNSKHRFAIGSGELAEALVQLGSKSEILLQFDPALTEGKTSLGIKGHFTVEEGLQILLNKSNLQYQVIDQETIKIIPKTSHLQSSIDKDKVVVTATKNTQTVTRAPASVTIISAEDLQRQPLADFSDVLRQQVGINVNQSQATGRREIQIRGMDSQYTLILINGRRTNSAEALIRGNDFDLSTIPINSIERIEVIRGPMSALYGSDALGGVINVITKKAADEWQTTVGLSAETPQDGSGGDTYQQTLYTSGMLSPDLGLSFTFENSNRDGWKAMPDEPGNNLNESVLDLIEKRDQLNTRLSLDYELDEQQTLALDLNYSDDDRFTRYDSWGSESFTDQDSQRIAVDGRYRGNFGDFSTDIGLGVEQTDLSDETDRYAVKKAEQRNYVLNSSISYFGSNTLTTAGFEITRTEASSDTDWVDTASVNQKALFAQSEVELGDAFTLTLGARLDDHDFFGQEFSPRAYLVYSPNNHLTIKGGYSEAFNAPDLFQLSENYRVVSCGGACYLTGNKDLQSETAKNYELGINYEQPGFSIGLTYFDNQVDNLIERNFTDRFDVGLDNPVIYYNNVSQAVFKGWEFDVSKAVTDTIDLSFNATFIDATNEVTGEKLQNRPDRNMNLALDWRPNNSAKYYARIRHIGQIETWSAPSPGYEVIDLGGSMQLNEALTLRGGINNLTDERLDLSDDYYEQVLLGRSFFLSAQYQF